MKTSKKAVWWKFYLIAISMRYNKAVRDLNVALDVCAEKGANHTSHFLITTLVGVDDREENCRVNFYVNRNRTHFLIRILFRLNCWEWKRNLIFPNRNLMDLFNIAWLMKIQVTTIRILLLIYLRKKFKSIINKA